jgi:hypothetical protein
MAKKIPNEVQRDGVRLVKCSKGDFSMHVAAGTTAREMMGFAIKHRQYPSEAAYQLQKVDGTAIPEDELIPSDPVLLFVQLEPAKV